MRPVHLLGLGFVIGMSALGAMTAAIAYRWEENTFPESRVPVVARQPAGQPGGPTSQDVAQGRTLFNQKCSSCHTIGGGKLAGPDLKGVTAQRPHDWLVRFIIEPDRVIASGDPIATQLVQEYGGIPMPNVGVTEPQAEQILAFVEFQTSGSVPAPPGPTSPPAGHAMAEPVGASPTAAGAAAPTAPAPMAATSPTAPTAIAPTAPVSAAPAAAPPSQASAAGKTLFDQKCAGCHTIGGGRRAGPDLKGVTAQRPHDWLVRIIVEPDKLIASGDPTATQLVQEYGGVPMPNLGVTNEQAEQMLAYIQEQSGEGPTAAAVTPTPLPPGNPAAGRLLYTGEQALSRGGPACIECHNVAGLGGLSGGTWGLDLTDSASRNGQAGLISIMKSPPFPGMTEAYDSRPIADSEAADIAAYLEQVGARSAAQTPAYAFPVIALGLFVLLVALSLLAWRNRTPEVHRSLIRR